MLCYYLFFVADEGNGEAPGSHGDGPLAALFPAAPAAGTSPADLPAAALLLLQLGGPACPATPQPGAAVAPRQTRPRGGGPPNPPAAQLHLPGAGRRAPSAAATGPSPLPTGLPLILAAHSGTAAAIHATRGAPAASALSIPSSGLRPPGSSTVLLRLASQSDAVVLARLLFGPSGHARGSWTFLSD